MRGRVRIEVNGVSRVVRVDRNVFEAVREQIEWSGREWHGRRPHFCYKEGRRGVSASCRICRVEREGGRKPVPSCALPVAQGRRVWTESPMVAKVREGVRERLLRNHPLDCPICDQGGECDLQEQTREYGSETSRIRERKRGVEDKALGGHVKMVITRCIHCTRCVRYGKQVGKRGRGIRGRGKEAEIGRYTEEAERESVRDGNKYHRVGNRVDRCPVGARTAETGKFAVRPWERKRVETVDRRDGVGVPVAMKYVRGERARVSPKRGERGERLGDKTRYGYDGRKQGRRRERQRKGSSKEVEERRREREEGEEARERGVSVAKGEVGKKRLERRKGAKRVVGTGVDRGRRGERKREERRGVREREGLGVGKRGELGRHSGERKRGIGVKETKQRTRGRRIGYERPVRRRNRKGEETGRGRGGRQGERRGLERGEREERAEGRSRERRSWGRGEKGGVGKEVRRGGGLWGREDGSGWVKRKGKRGKGREERGKEGKGAKRRQHRTNTQGRRGIGI